VCISELDTTADGSVAIRVRPQGGARQDCSGTAVYRAADVTAACAAFCAFFCGFLEPVFFKAGFFPAVACGFWASAFFNAQRFFVASLIAFRPASLSRRLGGLGMPGDDPGSASPLALAHLACCAAAILRRPAALILRLGAGPPAGEVSVLSGLSS
jgi:hypothetical protein